MDTETLFKAVGGVVLGLLGYLFGGFVGALVGVGIGIFAGPPLAKKFLNSR